jgi:hypothetical protein
VKERYLPPIGEWFWHVNDIGEISREQHLTSYDSAMISIYNCFPHTTEGEAQAQAKAKRFKEILKDD